ncbi:hypothetical protein J6590_100002, partial [Homalodisca vitripennis]
MRTTVHNEKARQQARYTLSFIGTFCFDHLIVTHLVAGLFNERYRSDECSIF